MNPRSSELQRWSPRRTRRSAAVACAAVALVAASCGSSDDTSGDASATGDSSGDSAAAAAPTASAGTDSSAAEGEPTRGGVLRYATASEPTSLDPHTGTSGGDHVYLYAAYDTLLNADPETLEPQPGLATKWKFVDERTLELTLRQGVKFHDGTPFNADAVVYNIERGLNMEDSAVKPELATVKSAEATSENVVRVNLTQPDGSLLGVFADRAGMMVSPKAGEAGTLKRNPVGTGPHRFVEWQTGNQVTYERNDQYWQKGLPYLDGLEISVMSDIDTRVNGLRAGQIDFIDGLEPEQLNDLEQESDLVVSSDPTLLQHMIWWNVKRGPLEDVRVRRAINMAIDREGLWEATMEGTGEPAWMPVPSQHWAYAEDLVPTFEYDPEQAKALLEEAGYGDGFTLTITSSSPQSFVRRAEIVQAQLSAIGITLEVQPQETVQSVTEYFQNRRVDGYNSSMTARPDPSITYQTIFSKTSYHNTSDWSPEGFEELLAEARAASTPEKRAPAFAELAEMAVDQALWVPLVYPSSITAHSSDVGGFTPSLIGKPNFLEVYKAG